MSLGKARIGKFISIVCFTIFSFTSLGLAIDAYEENGLNIGHYLLFILAGISFISWIIFACFCKCPTCKSMLGKGTFFADFCPHCGKKLD